MHYVYNPAQVNILYLHQTYIYPDTIYTGSPLELGNSKKCRVS